MIKIEREAIDAYGGAEKFDADVFTFKEALKKHAKTIGQAAPTAHPYVEIVVRQGGGKYEVIEPVVVTPEIPPKSLEELQTEAFYEVKVARQQMMKSGVVLNGVTFSSELESLTAMLAARDEARDADNPAKWTTRWKVGTASYVLVTLADLEYLVKAIRLKHKRAFENEQRLSEDILAANTPKALEKIDLSKGWDN